MEIVIVHDIAEAGSIAGAAIERLVTANPTAVLGLATGSSPLPIYDDVIQRCQTGLRVEAVTAFTLDEYLGLPVGHPESYRSFIKRVFTEPVGIADENLHSPAVNDEGVEALCESYERQIEAAGGIDLQILGIGSDGHIGFNEPSSSLGSRTRIKTLVTETRQDNARFFGGNLDQVPTHVVTQGIGTILEARHLIMIAAGESKARAIAAAVEGPLSAMVPASALQLHPHVTVLVDEGAASQLKLADYYRSTYATKPDWQSI